MKKKGFTIIELLVVISIIAILSGIVLIDYRSGQQAFALQRTASKLAQDIRRAQEMAMSAGECTFCDLSCSPNGVPSGYMVVFTSNPNYSIFADDGDKVFDSGDCNILGNPIPFEKGIVIDALSSDLTFEPFLSITFTPPDPIVTICHGSASCSVSSGWIRLCIEGSDCLDPSNTKTININTVGRIEID